MKKPDCCRLGLSKQIVFVCVLLSLVATRYCPPLSAATRGWLVVLFLFGVLGDYLLLDVRRDWLVVAQFH